MEKKYNKCEDIELGEIQENLKNPFFKQEENLDEDQAELKYKMEELFGKNNLQIKDDIISTDLESKIQQQKVENNQTTQNLQNQESKDQQKNSENQQTNNQQNEIQSSSSNNNNNNANNGVEQQNNNNNEEQQQNQYMTNQEKIDAIKITIKQLQDYSSFNITSHILTLVMGVLLVFFTDDIDQIKVDEGSAEQISFLLKVVILWYIMVDVFAQIYYYLLNKTSQNLYDNVNESNYEEDIYSKLLAAYLEGNNIQQKRLKALSAVNQHKKFPLLSMSLAITAIQYVLFGTSNIFLYQVINKDLMCSPFLFYYLLIQTFTIGFQLFGIIIAVFIVVTAFVVIGPIFLIKKLLSIRNRDRQQKLNKKLINKIPQKEYKKPQKKVNTNLEKQSCDDQNSQDPDQQQQKNENENNANNNNNNDDDVENNTYTQECIICMCEYEDKEKIVTLNCQQNIEHSFHYDCAKEWLKDHMHCPVCRKKVIESDYN